MKRLAISFQPLAPGAPTAPCRSSHDADANIFLPKGRMEPKTIKLGIESE